MRKGTKETFVTASEAAAEKGVSREAMAKAAREGRIPAVKVGRQWLIRRQDLEAWKQSPRTLKDKQP
jgi:excisionase family DNA binding protein